MKKEIKKAAYFLACFLQFSLNIYHQTRNFLLDVNAGADFYKSERGVEPN